MRAAQCKEIEVACPIRRPPEVGKRGENSPEAVNDEYKFIVLVETIFQNESETWFAECVGTIVTENQVITAGHCVQPDLMNNAKVSEVNVFFLHRSHAHKCFCVETRVRAFINYDLLSFREPPFDLGLL